MSGLLRSNLVVAAGTALSRVTGLLRVFVFAYVVGQTLVADAYKLANETPNIVYDLLLGGVLSATLVPLFTSFMGGLGSDDGSDDADDHATNVVITVATTLMVALTVVAVVLAGQQRLEFRRLGRLVQTFHHAGQIRRHVLALAREFEEGLRLLDQRAQFLGTVDAVQQAGALLLDLAGAFQVAPHVRLRELLIQLADRTALGIDIKGTP